MATAEDYGFLRPPRYAIFFQNLPPTPALFDYPCFAKAPRADL